MRNKFAIAGRGSFAVIARLLFDSSRCRDARAQCYATHVCASPTFRPAGGQSSAGSRGTCKLRRRAYDSYKPEGATKAYETPGREAGS